MVLVLILFGYAVMVFFTDNVSLIKKRKKRNRKDYVQFDHGFPWLAG